MIRLTQAVIVEGKYDKIKLSSVLDALIIETNGFHIFKDKEKLALIKKLAETRGIIIMTDSDAAGFKIRSYIGGSVDPTRVCHAYIPDILGKEHRKVKPSSEGKIGVEGVSVDIILDALKRANVIATVATERTRLITKSDLYEAGLNGGADSKEKRCDLLNKLGLPSRLSSTSMLGVLNAIMTYEEFLNALGEE
jgi:ribonuclease M5